MFSPYYAWARRRGGANPRNHCAFNIALYGDSGARWAMTERGQAALRTHATSLQIGRSALRWEGDTLIADIDECCVPLPRRIRGSVRLQPRAMLEHAVELDASGRHRWTPIAPSARVEVNLTSPSLRWSGEGYFDGNNGDEPLERRLRQWHWSRSRLHDATAVVYDVCDRDGRETSFALRFGDDGSIETVVPPPACALRASGWRIERKTRSENGVARIIRTLEDTPFYARSVVSSQILGEAAPAIHESLDLDRFASPIVQAMLPFRMPRSTRSVR